VAGPRSPRTTITSPEKHERRRLCNLAERAERRLTGDTLTVDDVVAVATGRARVVIAEAARDADTVKQCTVPAETEAGGGGVPPVPALYPRPQSLEDVISHVVARALGFFGLEAAIPRLGMDE
jgi:hypothetical protein